MISGNLIKLKKRDFMGFKVGMFTRKFKGSEMIFWKDWVNGESLWFLGNDFGKGCKCGRLEVVF